MPNLRALLDLDRCPHCGVDRPTLTQQGQFVTTDMAGQNQRLWRAYSCSRCGGAVLGAARSNWDSPVVELHPSAASVDDAVPQRARNYLSQALNSLSAPSGAVMLAASAVDAMLKTKGLASGSLYQRIDGAAQQHLITADMAQCARGETRRQR
jgi:hypothetical protein